MDGSLLKSNKALSIETLLRKAKEMMNQIEKLEIEVYGELLQMRILEKKINIDMNRRILKELG